MGEAELKTSWPWVSLWVGNVGAESICEPVRGPVAGTGCCSCSVVSIDRPFFLLGVPVGGQRSSESGTKVKFWG